MGLANSRSLSPKLGEWVEKFLESIPTTSTRIRYLTSAQHIRSHWGNATRLSAISVRSIEEFKAKRLQEVGPACVNRDLAVLRQLLKLAARQRIIGRNPFEAVDMLNERSTRRQPVIIDFENERKILLHAAPHLRAMVVLLVETGLRVNKEALQLRWADIDFAESTLTVRLSKSIAGRRSVPLSTLCSAELLRWSKLVGTPFSEFVFPSMSDPSKPLGSIKKTWATAVKHAGLQPFPIYCLRATFASRLSAAGVPDGFVSQMLGHAGGLLQTYSKAVDEYRRDAIRKLELLREAYASQHHHVKSDGPASQNNAGTELSTGDPRTWVTSF